jgi:hypothetical protein
VLSASERFDGQRVIGHVVVADGSKERGRADAGRYERREVLAR